MSEVCCGLSEPPPKPAVVSVHPETRLIAQTLTELNHTKRA